MYVPPAFRVDDIADVHRTMREARSATLVTATQEGLIGTPLPMLLNESEGPNGTLYAHVARANPQWKLTPSGEAMAIFAGPEAYVSPILVRDQAGDAQGRANVELRRRSRLWPCRVLRRCGAAARRDNATDEFARATAKGSLGGDGRPG